MKDIYQLVQEHEINLEDFLNWQIEHRVSNDFRGFAEQTAKAQDVFKYAAILYPKFILIENTVVLSDHYSEENWAEWREKCGAKDTANIVNHVHIDDYLSSDYQATQAIENGLGELLVFFWQLAVNHQFPEHHIVVEYDGNEINILNP